MEVTYLGHYGDDLVVVNAARVSFGKRKEVFDDKDARLINYLASHKHMLPFRHPQVSFHFKAPVFVARQLVKHQVGMSWSEISRRYVTGEPELWWPDVWRAKAENVKQGSSQDEWQQTTLVRGMTSHDGIRVASTPVPWQEMAKETAANMISIYEDAILHGMAPEQARMILPLNLMTEWHWTGSLLAWAHVWNERTAAGAQKETQDCVRLIGPKMAELFPVSWGVLTSD